MDKIKTFDSSLKLGVYDDEAFMGIDLEPMSKFRLGKFTSLDHAATVANLVRRSLMLHVPATGIVAVKIPEVSQEFSSIPGVKEDVIELILNLRKLVFKNYLRKPILTHIKFNGPGIVTAADISGLGSLVNVDSQQYIATVDTEKTLELTLVIATCTGFFDEGLPPDYLPVETVFAPVTSAVYHFESFDGASNSDVEPLESVPSWDVILELKTNGSISPLYALMTALRAVRAMFTDLPTTLSDAVSMANALGIKPPREESVLGASASPQGNVSDDPDFENLSINVLNLSSRIQTVFEKENISVIADLLKYRRKDLLQFKNMGKKSVQVVVERLSQVCGVELG